MLREKRESWDVYFLKLADLVSTRSTCDRKHVGTVIVKDKKIISTGYNGSLPGAPHCSDPKEYWQCNACGQQTTNETTIVNFHDNKNGLPCHGKWKKLEGGHLIIDNHCQRTLHSEINAIAQAAKLGIALESAKLYCNTKPCWSCLKTIIASGISEVIYKDEYGTDYDDRIEQLKSSGVHISLRKIKI